MQSKIGSFMEEHVCNIFFVLFVCLKLLLFVQNKEELLFDITTIIIFLTLCINSYTTKLLIVNEINKKNNFIKELENEINKKNKFINELENEILIKKEIIECNTKENLNKTFEIQELKNKLYDEINNTLKVKTIVDGNSTFGLPQQVKYIKGSLTISGSSSSVYEYKINTKYDEYKLFEDCNKPCVLKYLFNREINNFSVLCDKTDLACHIYCYSYFLRHFNSIDVLLLEHHDNILHGILLFNALPKIKEIRVSMDIYKNNTIPDTYNKIEQTHIKTIDLEKRMVIFTRN